MQQTAEEYKEVIARCKKVFIDKIYDMYDKINNYETDIKLISR